MNVYALTCPECGTVVAGNVLESSRLMKCPGVDCTAELQFSDLPEDAKEDLLVNHKGGSARN
jgi:hypothetical protein